VVACLEPKILDNKFNETDSYSVDKLSKLLLIGKSKYFGLCKDKK